MMTRTRCSALGAASLMAGLAASLAGSPAGHATTSSPATPAPAITIQDGALHTRYREAPFAFGTFVLGNHSGTDRLLQGISSPACQSVTSNRNSQLAIQSANDADDIFQRMAVPHDGTMVFPTGGYHLICHGLKIPYQPGQTVPFTFHFRDAGDVTASFVMQPIVEENHVGP